MHVYRRLVPAALLLTFIVVVFGAYVRLSDAGLGCPDWPGCYGSVTPHHAADEILQAEATNPHGPVSLPKAWKEMIHRYLASSLGLLIVAIAILAWRRDNDRAAPRVASALVGVVVLQGLLGKWTVTLLLKPAIVTAHLLGGLTTLGLLVWLALRASGMSRATTPRSVVLLARVGLLMLVAQIVLGGWTSTNYAALACAGFPSCHGSLWPDADYGNAFHVTRELGMTADGELLPLAALTAIHWSHRVGAMLAGTVLLLLASVLVRRRETRLPALALAATLGAQIALGVANVVFNLPLPLAVAHNAGAALLVVVMVWINYRLTGVAAPVPAQGRGHERAEHQYSFA